MSCQFITSDQGDEGVVVAINDPEAKNAVNRVMNRKLIAEHAEKRRPQWKGR